MKQFSLESLGGLSTLLPALVLLPFCGAGFWWDPRPYLVSTRGVASLLLGALLVLAFWHLLWWRGRDRAPGRGLIWLWSGWGGLVLLPWCLLRRGSRQPQKNADAYYFFSDLLGLVLLVLMTYMLCLMNYEPVRDELLFQYKKKHIDKGLMYHKHGWGWVDKVHYRPDHFEDVMRALEQGQEQLSLSDSWRTPLGIDVHFEVTYGLENPQQELQRWALATAVVCDFMEHIERMQEQSPWYHGHQLSAWQFDDVSSGLLACLEQCPKADWRPQNLGAETSISLLQQRWRQEGRQLVGVRSDAAASWRQSEAAEAAALAAAAKWQQLSATRR